MAAAITRRVTGTKNGMSGWMFDLILGLTSGKARARKKLQARMAVVFAFLALCFFLAAGQALALDITGSDDLTWRTDVPDGTKLGELVFPDAASGDVAAKQSALDTAVAAYNATPDDTTRQAVLDAMAALSLSVGNNPGNGIGTLRFTDDATLTATVDAADQRLNVGSGAANIDVAAGKTLTIAGNAYTFAMEYNAGEDSGGGALFVDTGGLFAKTGLGTLVFEGNSAENSNPSGFTLGGALYNWLGVVDLGGSTIFVNNTSKQYGGAVYNEGTMHFSGSAMFTGNTAGHGGAITNNEIMHFSGPATFTGNTADYGGAIYNSAYATMSFSDVVTFTGNTATTGFGGAIVNYDSTMSLYGTSTFMNNTAATYGGAIFNRDSLLTLSPAGASNTILFSGNTANGNPNSVFMADYGILNVSGNGVVDMRDPMGGDATTFRSAITKSGSGTWKLGGANTFTASSSGYTTFAVNEGTLHLYRSLEQMTVPLSSASISLAGSNSSFSLASGATLSLGGSGHSIAAPTITLADGSTLAFDLTHHSATAATPMLTLTGAVSAGNGLALDLLSLKSANTWTLVSGGDYTGLTATAPTFRGEAVSGTLLQDTLSLTGGADNLALTVGAVPDNAAITWNGASGGSWNLASTNWDDAARGVASAGQYLPGDAVAFTDAGAGTVAINDGGVVVSDMTVSGGNYTFTGGGITATDQVFGSALTPARKLTLSGGSADFTGISGENRFDGGVSIGAARLAIANERQLGTNLANLTFTQGAPTAVTNAVTDLSAAITNNTGIETARNNLETAINVARGVTLGVLAFTQDASFTASPGSAEQTLAVGEYAAAFDVANGATLTISGNDKVSAGGALFVMGTSALFAKTGEGTIVFDSNKGASGGAIYNNRGAIIMSGSATFTNNSGTSDGGAINNNLGTTSLSGPSLFKDNTADGRGGAISNAGRISLSGQASFVDNEAVGFGGAIFNSISSTVTMSGGSFFESNSASGGGAILNYGVLVLSGEASFTDNTAANDGGAILNAEGTVSLTAGAGESILFSGNKASGAANSIFMDSKGALNINSDGQVDIRDPMGGAAGDYRTIYVAKTGGGAWNLGGSNVFTAEEGGKTIFTVSGGTLHLYRAAEVDNGRNGDVATGSISMAGTDSSFSLASGAALSLGGSGHTIAAPTITLADGSILAFDLAHIASNGSAVALNLSADTYNLASSAALNSSVNLSNFMEGTFVLARADSDQFGSITNFGTPTLQGGLNGRASLSLSSANNGKDLLLTAASAGNLSLTWTGTVDGNWNMSTDNWSGSTDSKFLSGDMVVFDAVGSAARSNVAVDAGGVTVGGMSITGGSYTFSGGKITGRTDSSTGIRPTGRLNIAGDGNIVFNNAVEFERGISVDTFASANLTLADYTGGYIFMDWGNAFSGKVHIENQRPTNTNAGGAMAVFVHNVVIREGSLIRGNAIEETRNNDSTPSQVFGGAISLFGYTHAAIGGEISDNLAAITNTGTGGAESHGGGIYTDIIDALCATVSGNKAVATASGGGIASALGGGLYGEGGDITITGGAFTGNQAIAIGGATRAEGGAIFMNTSSDAGAGVVTLTLDPTAGVVSFSGNTVTTKSNAGDTGTTTANAIHFGRYELAENAAVNAVLAIKDSTTTNNLITIADGITTDINNDKTFTMTQSGGTLLWGGPNLFDSEGEDTVNLSGGTTRLMNGFSLDRGAVNGGTGLLAFNVTGGHLKSEGAAASLKNTALAIGFGGKLTVDLGSVLTLDAASTFSLNGGILSVGVGAGNTSGKIVSQNTTVAPTFSGSNTLDISSWIPGSYTALEAGTAMAAGAPGTFTAYTIGGNAIDPLAYSLSAALSGDSKSLLVNAALNQDSSQKTWGGTSGTWNYTNTNWLPGTSKFVLGDLALFDGTNAGGAGLAVTVGGDAIETAGMRITGGSYTFSGGKIVGRTNISEGDDITPTGRLDIAGSSTIVFNNAVDFVNGLTVEADSPANITLTDYTGGQIFVDSGYSGNFSGKLNIQGLDMSAGGANFIGGALALKYGGTLNVQAGSLFQGNTMTGSGSAVVSINGGMIYADTIAAFSGTVKNNTVTATSSNAIGGIYGGGVYAGSMGTFSGIVEGNNATATGNTKAQVYGGGVYAGTGGIAALSGKITGNTARASSTDARASGGGLYARGGVYASGGSYSTNQAIATGTGARAEGGAIFMDTSFAIEAKLILDPTIGAITFSGNKTVVNGVETPNAVHFGTLQQSDVDASLTIRDSASTGHLVTIEDGVTTGINNGKTFTMSQTSGSLLWGGPNLFDSAGGDTVSLTGGTTRLMNGFSLDRGAVNGGTGLLAMNVTGGHLKSEGAAASLKNTALSVISGGKLTVDLGSTLTLDAASTFSLNNGTLSFGVSYGNASGKIVSQNAVTAPTFSGSNSLDISQWTLGAYTVLQAATVMDAGAPDTFNTFTVGGNALSGGVAITPTLSGDGKSLIVTAGLERDNCEVVWGGVSGNWNYTEQKWSQGGNACVFLPGDAALFTCASPQNITLGGNSISLSGMRLVGDASHILSGAALHIDSSNAQKVADPGYLNILLKESSGTLLLQTGSASNPNRIAGDVLVTNGILALGNGFTLNHTGAGGFLSVNAGVNIPALEVRGAAAIKDMSLQLVAGASELRFTSNTSALALNTAQTSYLGQGVMDVDLNRSKTLAALSVTGGGALSLDQSTLRVRHTGLVSDAGSWLILSGDYLDYEGNQNSGKSFETLDIATATLEGVLRSESSQVFFDGTYTVAGTGPGEPFAGFNAMPSNARRAWPGFQDAFYNKRTPFMDALELAYNSPTEFQADLPRILNESHAEGAASQGLHALGAHSAAVGTALGYAFPNGSTASAQNFAPLAFQASFSGQRHSFDMMGNGKSRREQATATARYADRMDSLDGNMGHMPQSYSVLANWQPASDMTRTLVASASPEYTLHAAGANTPFGIRAWGGYFGDFAHQDKRGGYAGYDADHNGFLLGGSFDINSNWTAGVWAGWTSGETRYSGIKTRIETDATHVGAFARYKKEAGPGTVKVTGDMAYSFTDNDSRRTVPTAVGNQRMKGSFDQNIYGGGLEISYDWSPQNDPATVLTPFLSARYSHLEQDGFTESGNLALKVGKSDADSFTTSLGITAARDFSVSDTVILTPKATLGWRRQWADDTVSTRSSFVDSPVTFMSRSVKQDKDAAIVGAGLDILIRRESGWDMGLKFGYGADLSKNANDQNVFVGFEVKF